MRRSARGVLVAVIILCLAAGGYWFYRGLGPHAKTPEEAAEQSAPVAEVSIVPLKTGRLSTFVTAYGDVVPAPGAIKVVSVPYESRVRRVMVSEGQKVSRGEALVEVEPSPNTQLQFEQAQTASGIAAQKLAHVRELFALKLATNAQLLQAEEAARQASTRLESLRKRGVDGKRIIRSVAAGLASKVYIQEGAIAGAGNPLVDIVSQNRLEVRLGVEPGDVARLVPGQSVRLSYVNISGAPEISGRIRKISRAVNPSTRLVDVFVALPPSAGYLLGEYIESRIKTASSCGLIVPRSAVLPENGEHVLFTVQNGHAVRHSVQVLLENDRQALVSGAGLKPGEKAVVLGNYELTDGMAVRITGTR